MKFSRRGFLATASALAASGAQRKTLVIDAHCHAGRGQAMSAPWNTVARVEDTLRTMEEAGIDRTIIFPINNTSFEKPNQEIAEIVARHPDKFIGFAKHDPQTEAGKIAPMLRREVESLGLKGLKLHVLPTREVLDTVAELGIPILYHPDRVSSFHLLAQEYPKIPFIIAHLGSFASANWTEHIAAIDMAKRYPNVYLDTSGVVFWKYLEQAAKEAGPGKLIFGSDGPELDQRVELYKVRLLKLRPEEDALVTGGNISKLLNLGDSPSHAAS